MRLRPIAGTWIDYFLCGACEEPSEGSAIVVAGELPLCRRCVAAALREVQEAAPDDADLRLLAGAAAVLEVRG